MAQVGGDVLREGLLLLQAKNSGSQNIGNTISMQPMKWHDGVEWRVLSSPPSSSLVGVGEEETLVH
jgi:hypothetical protein